MYLLTLKLFFKFLSSTSARESIPPTPITPQVSQRHWASSKSNFILTGRELWPALPRGKSGCATACSNEWPRGGYYSMYCSTSTLARRKSDLLRRLWGSRLSSQENKIQRPLEKARRNVQSSPGTFVVSERRPSRKSSEGEVGCRDENERELEGRGRWNWGMYAGTGIWACVVRDKNEGWCKVRTGIRVWIGEDMRRVCM